jgi:multiple sugar transport system substrate-binding protein
MNDEGKYFYEVGIASVPQIDISNPKAVMQGPSLCIFNHGDEERLTAAWLFVKFLTTCPELQANFSVAYGYMPVTEATLENEAYVEYLESANGYDNVTALAIKAGFEQSDAYYSASAFVGSADAREIVGRLLRDCIIYDGEDVGAYIDEAFKNAVESCEMYR